MWKVNFLYYQHVSIRHECKSDLMGYWGCLSKATHTCTSCREKIPFILFYILHEEYIKHINNIREKMEKTQQSYIQTANDCYITWANV